MHEAIAQVPRYCAFPLSKGKQQISLSNPNANNSVNWPSLWLFTLTPLLSFHQTLSGSGYTPGMQQWYLPLSWKDSALVFLPLLLEPEEQIRQPLVAEEVGGYTSKQRRVWGQLAVVLVHVKFYKSAYKNAQPCTRLGFSLSECSSISFKRIIQKWTDCKYFTFCLVI